MKKAIATTLMVALATFSMQTFAKGGGGGHGGGHGGGRASVSVSRSAPMPARKASPAKQNESSTTPSFWSNWMLFGGAGRSSSRSDDCPTDRTKRKNDIDCKR